MTVTAWRSVSTMRYAKVSFESTTTVTTVAATTLLVTYSESER